MHTDMKKVIRPDFSRKLCLTPKPREGCCNHSRVRVCQKTRMLKCQQCNAVIDPFDFMWEWANRDRRLEMDIKFLMKSIEKLRVELKELKRQERNIKARIRRAKAQ